LQDSKRSLRERVFLEPADCVADIDLGDTVFTGIINGEQPDRSRCFLFLVCPVKFQHVQVRDMIPAYHEEILPVEIFLGIFYAAGGPELGLFMHVGDLDTEKRTVTQRFFDCGSHIPEREHDFPEAQVREV
jgi:hypothetical protein